MPRYRVCFDIDGPARFISHLNLVKTFERVMRRAKLPLAFSQGFNPHPRFSFGMPLPVGVGGRGEYVDIELTIEMPTEVMEQRLSAATPVGLEIKDVKMICDGAPSLMASVDYATYEISVHLEQPLGQEELEGCIKRYLELDTITTTRKTREGRLKERNIRPGIFEMHGHVRSNTMLLNVKLKAGSTGNVRPDELMESFMNCTGLKAVPHGIFMDRTGTYSHD